VPIAPRPVSPPSRPVSVNPCPIHYNNDYIQLVETGGFQNHLPELEGDVQALSLVDLDRYGLQDYKYLFPARHNPGQTKPYLSQQVHLPPVASTHQSYSTHRESPSIYNHYNYMSAPTQSYVPPSYIQQSYAPNVAPQSYDSYGSSYLY
jgi:hypothetical protein